MLDLMHDKRQLLTYSQMQSFLNCRRKAELRYERALVRRHEDIHALHFGDLIHECLRVWHRTRHWSAVDEYINYHLPARHTDRYQKRDAQHARAMLRGYTEHWRNDSFDVVALEEQFRGEIVNPDTGETHPSFIFGGKRDGIIRSNGGLFLLEHKTAATVDEKYIDKLWTDFQIAIYCYYLEQERQEPVRGVLYNVITKSKIKQGEGESPEEFQRRHTEAIAKNASGTTSIKQKLPENDLAFEERLAEVYRDPEMYTRALLIVSHDQLDGLRRQLWELAEDYARCQKRGFFLQNPGHCFAYFRACSYYLLCESGNSRLVLDSEYQHKTPHEELIEEVGDPFAF